MAFPLQWTLARKVAALGVLNLLLLVAAAAIFAGIEYRFGPESLLLAPARDRVEAVGVQFADQMNREGADPAVLITRYSAHYDAQFFLMTPDGDPIAGASVALPEALRDRLHGRPPRPGERGEKKGKKKDRKKEDEDERGEYGFRPPPEKGEERDPLNRPREPSFFAITTWPLAYWAGVRTPYQPPNADVARPAVLLIRSENVLTNHLFLDLGLWLGAGAGLVLISALCWVPFLRGLTRSIGVLDQATGQIAAGRFDVRIPDDRNDEIGHLGSQISRMSQRLDGFVKNQKRFLGDIAHELCAPLARIQFALGILEQRSQEGDQAHVARLRAEIQEMSDLVNELLSFSKADVQSGVIQRHAVDVAAVVQRAIVREDADAANLQVQVEPGLRAMANEVYLVRALANVLRNARRYAGDAGPISITAQRHGAQAVIEVADCGAGLDPAAIDQIFEPFYRPEADRSRDTGGAGLGLAIVRTCLEACGGTVTCANRDPHGLAVRLVLDQPPQA